MTTYNINTSGFTPAQTAAVNAAAQLAAPGNTVTTSNSGGASGGGSQSVGGGPANMGTGLYTGTVTNGVATPTGNGTGTGTGTGTGNGNGNGNGTGSGNTGGSNTGGTVYSGANGQPTNTTTVTTAAGNYTVGSDGSILAGPSNGPYQVGSNMSAYSGQGVGTDSAFNTASTSLLPTNVSSEQSDYQGFMTQMQSAIDAANAAEVYAETQANIQATQSTSAMNAGANARGLAGSTEAQGQYSEIGQTQTAAIEAAKATQATAIANISNMATTDAINTYNQAVSVNDANSQAYIKQTQTNLSTALSGLASSGTTLSDLQTTNPYEYSQLLQYAGGDPNVLSEMYIQSASKNQTLLNNGQPLSQNGNSFIYGVATIGSNGQQTLSTQTLNLPFQTTSATAGWVMSKTGTNNSVYYDPNNAGNSIIYSVNPFTGQTTITGSGTGLDVLQGQGITPGIPGNGNPQTNSNTSSNQSTQNSSSNINSVTGLSTSEYGALAGVPGFNPNGSMIDLGAFNYIKNYLSSGGSISSSGMGGLAKYGAMNEIQQRAQDIYNQATGQNLPSAAELTNNQTLINTNSNLLNQLQVQEGTIAKNFGLNLSNLNSNNVNEAAPVINNIVNFLANAAGSPSVAQYLSQNQTIQNELASLLSVKNASGTTVADKLSSATVLPEGASVTQATDIINTLMQEANNQASVIGATNAGLYAKTDPLGLDPENPINTPGYKQLTGAGFTDNYNGTWSDANGVSGYRVEGNNLVTPDGTKYDMTQ